MVRGVVSEGGGTFFWKTYKRNGMQGFLWECKANDRQFQLFRFGLGSTLIFEISDSKIWELEFVNRCVNPMW